MNVIERLEKLRLKQGWSWDELGEAIELSRSMLHYVRKVERVMSERSLYRLAELERANGIQLPQEKMHEPATSYLTPKPKRGGSDLGVDVKVLERELISTRERLLADIANLQEKLRELKNRC